MVDHKFVPAYCVAAMLIIAVGFSVSEPGLAKQSKVKAKQSEAKAKAKVGHGSPGPRGKASIYSDRFNGKKTASGERFHQSKLTAASPVLPIGSKVKVTNRKNGKSVVVRVNDKQPKKSGRILDLSKSAAHKIGVSDGVAPVTTTVIKK